MHAVLAVSTPDGNKASGPRSRKGVLTRARLLEAAKKVFEEDGFLGARISDIAERAALSNGSFYHYFDSKEEIFREVAYAVDERLTAPLGNIILDPSSTAPPHERIRQAIRQHLESYREEARIMGVIEEVSRYDDELNAVRTKRHNASRAQVAESIRRLQRHGLADRSLNPALAAAVVGSMTNRFPEMWLVEHNVTCSFDEGVEHLTMIFLNALQIESPSRRPRKG